MSVADRVKMIDNQSEEVSISKQCDWLDLNRSTFYYQPTGINAKDLAIMRVLDELYLEDPTRGTRRMLNELRKKGFKLGRSHTRTLMQRMRLKTVYCRPRTTCIDPTSYKYPYLLRNHEITRSNQVWVADITYIPMARGYLYLFAIMDLKSRYIVGWSLSNTMETSWIVSTLKQAINRYGAPEIINTDQGSQFTSEEYVNFVKDLKSTRISMDGKGRAIDNVFIERFWRTIKYEKLYLTSFQSGQGVQKACEEFIDYYNYRRDHSSLDSKTPALSYKTAA